MFHWILFVLITPILSEEKCLHYIPGSDPSNQPHTYCSPKEFNWNCSIAIPGTIWHNLPGHYSWGRCCRPVYVWNGTFNMCESNGKSDSLTSCGGDGLYNWNSPFSSAEIHDQSVHADLICHRQRLLSDSDIPLVKWKQSEFIVRQGQPITIWAEVHSSTEVVRVALLRENMQFPQKESRTLVTVGPHSYNIHFEFNEATSADGGGYYLVATNKEASGWSGITRLTVLQGNDEATSGYPSIRSIMALIICMACLVLFY